MFRKAVLVEIAESIYSRSVALVLSVLLLAPVGQGFTQKTESFSADKFFLLTALLQ